VTRDVLRWVADAPGVDLAFADPPYAFDDWPVLAGALRARLLVAESNRQPDLGHEWEVLRAKRYGTTVVVTACRRHTP
jgi:16S rRNA G966 N2-methylase RsmD